MLNTKVWIRQEPGAQERLLALVTPTSHYQDIKPKGSMFDEKVQRDVAEQIIDGWRMNGPWRNPQFRIETCARF